MDFLNPSGMSTATEVQQPQMLHCELKKYQLKGLQWLANLYDQVGHCESCVNRR
jgi:DNA helicase INO80